MKKTFALLMAALMTASMTTVAFAADETTNVAFGVTSSATGVMAYAYWEQDDVAGLTTKGDGLPVDEIKIVDFADGDKIYVPIVVEVNGAVLKDATKMDQVDGWDLAASWEVGKAETPEFEVVKIDGERRVCAVVEIPENDTLSKKDLLGYIGVGKTKSAAKKATGDQLLNIDLAYGANVVDFYKWDGTSAIVNFEDEDDEVDIEFGDYATFTVDVRGQKKVDLRYDTKYNADFNELYEYANIEYLNFTGNPIFNRNGMMYIYADEDMYLYEVTEDGAKEVDGAEYDEDEGAFVFKTRTLKSYAISDEELDVDDVIADGEIVVEKPAVDEGAGKPNPDTGR